MKQSEIAALFDSQQFEQVGKAILALLVADLTRSLDGRHPVLDWQAPDAAETGWSAPLPRHAAMDIEAYLCRVQQAVLARSLHVHHPRNLGHQVAPPLPVAALADLVAALTNQAMAVYETGPAATMIERQVIAWLATLIGWQGAAGVLTSGGAQANLTALLAARQSMAGWDVWQCGVAAGPPLRILASASAHYSVSRAAGIMGLGAQAVLAVGTDEAGRMCPLDLTRIWQASVDRGEQPFVVVATAGSTPTGSVDPLAEIGDFCRAQRLWFHVDGAHGASMLLSEQRKAMLDGIALADSVVWDGHKLMFMPAAVSAVIYRDPRHSYAAFAQEASYLFQGGSDEAEAYNTSYRTLECTKRMMGFKLWTAFSLYGTEAMGSLVAHVCDMARTLAEKIDRSEDFNLRMMPQTNIVCFRHTPVLGLSSEAMNRHQAELRRQLVESGAFHLTQTRLDDSIWLRATVMNPLTTAEDFDALLSRLRSIAASIVD